MKVSLSSAREYNRKIRLLSQRLEQSEKKNKAYSKQNKYLKKRQRELLASRDKWKAKNKSRRLVIKSLEKGVKRNERVKRHPYPLFIMVLCIKLRVQAGCSYRGICKILVLLQSSLLLNMKKLPCANTIENWTSKMGYYCLETVKEKTPGKQVCLIMDETIKQGNERILLILFTPWNKDPTAALDYTDVKIGYLGGKTSWTGEKIKDEITKLAKQKELEIKGILSDEDSKLLKSSRLLGLAHLPDINHALATCLRNTFEKSEEYQGLIKQISAYQYKAVNQDLTYLRPPKQRVKARFMNQKGFVDWGLTMLEKFDELNEKEKAFFEQLPNHQPMLNLVCKCINVGEQIAQILKIKGLSSLTIHQVEQIYYQGIQEVYFPVFPLDKTKLKTTSQACPVGNLMLDDKQKGLYLFAQFLKHLKSYIDKYKLFLTKHKGVFNVSSDIIESMFGKHKSMCATNTLVGVSQLDLELPIHCIEPEDIYSMTKMALEATFTSDLTTWKKVHSSDNQANRRRAFFQKRA